MRNCIILHNDAPQEANYGSNTWIEYSCTVPLPASGVGNIISDPDFLNAAAGDFRLRPDSLCIDAGADLSGLLTTDIAGVSRPLDGNGDGVARFDIGAYEFDPSVPFITRVTLTRTGLRLEWLDAVVGSKLQRTSSVINPLWQDVPGSETATTITLPVANAAEFFRLVKP